MGARRRQGFCGRKLWPLLAVVAAAPAAAAERPCPVLAVEADPGVQTRWPDLAARIRAAFGGRDDIDACGHVRLGLRDASIEVTVALPDGRSASRVLERPDDVRTDVGRAPAAAGAERSFRRARAGALGVDSAGAAARRRGPVASAACERRTGAACHEIAGDGLAGRGHAAA